MAALHISFKFHYKSKSTWVVCQNVPEWHRCFPANAIATILLRCEKVIWWDQSKLYLSGAAATGIHVNTRCAVEEHHTWVTRCVLWSQALAFANNKQVCKCHRSYICHQWFMDPLSILSHTLRSPGISTNETGYWNDAAEQTGNLASLWPCGLLFTQAVILL